MRPVIFIGSILIVAAIATAGDLAWYALGVRHTVTAGVIHGALLLMAVGGALGAACGRVVKGLPIGAIAGVGGALTYYAIEAVTEGPRYGPAIPVAWIATWLMLAVLDGRWLRAPHRRSWAVVALRGAAAAISSGVAFAAVQSTLWGPAPPGGRNYLLQFVAWAVAWAPGLLALTIETRRGVRLPPPLDALPRSSGGPP